MAERMKVLVVGAGGREHALSLRLLACDSVDSVVVSPGSAGMTQLPPDLAHKKLIADPRDPLAILKEQSFGLAVVGPEVPLTDGLADRIRGLGVPCFGPSREAAELEGSKAFMKAFCKRHQIPVARDVVVETEDELKAALSTFAVPPVVKADGLCAGKGVTVAESHEEAREVALAMLSGRAFGAAGKRVILEERIVGAEASVHAICDGKRAFLLPVAQDHKRIFDEDRGPNTGGMGTYAPAPLVSPELHRAIGSEIMERVVRGMAEEGRPFVGALFGGFMVTAEGRAVVLEFNVRFGDPETQVLTQVIEGDFGIALLKAAQGELEGADLRVSSESAVCVVMAARGYPGEVEKGARISGLEEAGSLDKVRIFHAGTALVDGHLVASGGRVLSVSARGATLREAQERAYQAVSLIRFDGAQFRRDIAARALGRGEPRGAS